MPAARKISQTVDGATVTPSLVSSPWIRRCPPLNQARPGQPSWRADSSGAGQSGGITNRQEDLASIIAPKQRQITTAGWPATTR